MATFLIGDLHGHYRDFERLLIGAGLCDKQLNWTGGSDSLWLMGDFFDRGASGIKCLDLTIKLQGQAIKDGGTVNSLLGNHELMILCAYYFQDHSTSANETVFDQWLRWGGIESDFEGLTDQHADWISNLPAMAIVEDSLLVHADAMLYVNYGVTIDSVNEGFFQLMQSRDLPKWESTLAAFSEHMAFASLAMTGTQRARQLLNLYGGKQLVHGHTPIPYARQIEPEAVTEAWQYADDLCLNVDGGMYMGSPGFVHRL
jgi:hypothetical protein